VTGISLLQGSFCRAFSKVLYTWVAADPLLVINHKKVKPLQWRAGILEAHHDGKKEMQ
jgi:hypothetical protein